MTTLPKKGCCATRLGPLIGIEKKEKIGPLAHPRQVNGVQSPPLASMGAPRLAWQLSFAAGLLTVGAGLYILAQPSGLSLRDHSDFVGMTGEQLAASSPRVFEFVNQEVRLVGILFAGLGFLIAAVSWGGLRWGERWAWLALAGAAGFSAGYLGVAAGHHPPGGVEFIGLAAIVALQTAGLALGLPALQAPSK